MSLWTFNSEALDKGSMTSAEACIADIGKRMKSNIPKLNHCKTQFISFSSKQQVKKTGNLHIKIGSSYIKASASVRNLGGT